MKPRLAIMGALLVLAPAAQAGSASIADLTAAALQASGTNDVTGTARAFVYRSFKDQDQTHFTLALSAKHIHVEADHAQILANPMGIQVDGALWTDTADYDDATATVVGANPHFKIEALALPDGHFSAHLDSPCLRWTLPLSNTVEASKFAHSPRPIPSVATGGTVQITPCTGLMRLHGNFLLVLWEASLRVQGPHGTVAHHSGQGPAATRGPDGTATPTSTQQADQLYVTLHDAELTLDRQGTDGDMLAFLGTTVARVNGVLDASHARGQLVAPGHAQDLPTHVQLQGDLRLQAEGASQGILARIEGASSTVEFNGQPILLTSAAATARSSSGWVLLMGIATAAAAGMAWRIARRGREPWQFRLASALLAAEAPRVALAVASLKLRRTPDTRALLARIHLDAGNHRKAVAWATKADRALADPFHRAANCIVASLAAARLRDANDAGTWFAKAVHKNPLLWRYLENDEPLLSMSSHPSFQAWLRRVDPSTDLVAP